MIRSTPIARAAALLSALAALSAAPAAGAGEGAPISAARMADDMHAYFHGEKWEAPVFFGAGLAAGAAGAALVTRKDDLARGASYPVFAIGLAQLVVGAGIFLRTDAQVKKLDQQLATDPVGFKNAEMARMRRVNGQFTALLILEPLLIVGGVLTAAVAAQKECCRTLQGVGLGVAGQAAVTLSLDLFAAARGRAYAESLRRFDPRAPSLTAP